VTNVPKVIHNPTRAQSEQLPNLQENRNEDHGLDAIALPGVTIEFDSGCTMTVYSGGSVSAVGTEA